MFHHNHCVSRVTQSLQGAYQPTVVPLVQTDTGFVQNIQDIDQLRTNLRGQTDTLALAAR